jgi:transposase-like protein
MILAIRRGSSLRRVARRFGVSPMTVRRWVGRAKGQRLERLDLSDRPAGSRRPLNRTSRRLERAVLAIRRRLGHDSPLGDCGATAIAAELRRLRTASIPCVRTIGRILARNGVLDGRRRVRRPPPPKGWYLPPVAAGRAEIDSFDTITDLVIQGGQDVTVLNAMSLHGGLPGSWPEAKMTAKIVVDRLLEHWREHGTPGYAKFDNDTIFQGAHQWPDSFGRVIRLGLQLGVTPVFAPPREPGFQAEVEAYNGRWQSRVWRRFHHRNLPSLQRRSRAFVRAAIERSASRIAAAPARQPLPANFAPNFQRPLQGTVIFLRRADSQGRVECLGHRWLADRNWPHRLVRVEVDLTAGQARLFALRRREPAAQPLLKTLKYAVPKHGFMDK